MSRRVSFRAGLVWAMGLLSVAYVAALALYGVGWGLTADGWFDAVVNGWRGELTLAPIAVSWLAVCRVGLSSVGFGGCQDLDKHN